MRDITSASPTVPFCFPVPAHSRGKGPLSLSSTKSATNGCRLRHVSRLHVSQRTWMRLLSMVHSRQAAQASSMRGCSHLQARAIREPKSCALRPLYSFHRWKTLARLACCQCSRLRRTARCSSTFSLHASGFALDFWNRQAEVDRKTD